MKYVIIAYVGLSIGCLPWGCASSSSSPDDTVETDEGVSPDTVADSSPVDTAGDSVTPQDTAIDSTTDTNVEDTSVPGDTDTPTDIADTGTQDTGSWVLPPGLKGKPAPEALAFPTIAGVVDTSNTPVAPSDVMGKWTVIWFYPAAGTFG